MNSLQEFLRNKFYTLVEELVTQISLAHEQRVFHRSVLIVMGNNVKKIVKIVEKRNIGINLNPGVWGENKRIREVT